MRVTPDEPMHLPEDLMSSDPGATQPLAAGASPEVPAAEGPPTEPPTRPYAQEADAPPSGQQPEGQPGYHPERYGQPAYPQQPYGPPGYPPQPYGQQPYGQPAYPQQPYGQPAYPPAVYGQPVHGQPTYPPAVYRPDHPRATSAMVLGLVGLIGMFICGFPAFASPFAWVIGARTKREIDQSGGAYGGRDKAVVGMVTGIIGTVLLALAILVIVFVIAIAVTAPSNEPVQPGGF